MILYKKSVWVFLGLIESLSPVSASLWVRDESRSLEGELAAIDCESCQNDIGVSCEAECRACGLSVGHSIDSLRTCLESLPSSNRILAEIRYGTELGIDDGEVCTSTTPAIYGWVVKQTSTSEAGFTILSASLSDMWLEMETQPQECARLMSFTYFGIAGGLVGPSASLCYLPNLSRKDTQLVRSELSGDRLKVQLPLRDLTLSFSVRDQRLLTQSQPLGVNDDAIYSVRILQEDLNEKCGDSVVKTFLFQRVSGYFFGMQ